MSTDSLDRLIWRLIFIGMAVLGLGFAVAKTASPVAGPLVYTLVSAGALAVGVGAVLIVVRSRVKPPDASATEPQQQEKKP